MHKYTVTHTNTTKDPDKHYFNCARKVALTPLSISNLLQKLPMGGGDPPLSPITDLPQNFFWEKGYK